MQLTVGSHTISNYNAGGSTATLKIRANDNFLTSDGATVHRNYATPITFYSTVSCTVSGTTVTVPSFTIDSTTDSSVPNATYTGVLYDSNGNKVQAHFSGWRFPTGFGSSPTWTQLDTYNATEHPPFVQGYPTTDQVQTLINAAAIASVSLSNTYGNSLATAVSDIGSSIKTLLINADTTLSTSVTIPSTLFLKFEGGAKITKSASGAIVFSGIGLTNPESQAPIFSGFSSGDITWTGSTYPGKISTSLWADTALSTKITNATNAMSGKKCTLVAYPGDIAANFTLKTGHSLYLTRGSYTDSMNVVSGTRCWLESNTRVYGDGIGQTVYNCSTVTKNGRVFAASGLNGGGLDGTNENIEVSDVYFNTTIGTTPFDDGGACVNLGNCINGHIRRCYFKNTCQYGAYFGGFPTQGYYAQNCSVSFCVFDGVRGQNTGSINGENILVDNNIFMNIQIDVTNGLIVPIDFEPNTDADRIENIQITNNFFDGRNAVQNWNAIVVQAGGNTGGCNTGLIEGNTILGSANGKLINGILLAGCKNYTGSNNFIIKCAQSGLYVSNSDRVFLQGTTLRECGSGGTSAMQINATSNSRFDSIVFDEILGGGYTTDAGILESESTDTVNTSVTGNTVTRTAGGTIFLPHWVGKTVTINSVDYIVATVTSTSILTLTTNPGNQTGVSLVTKFSNNLYSDCSPVVYTLMNSSKATSARDRVVRDSYTPAQIAADQNDYQPSVHAYRLRLSTDASRNLTGLTWANFPLYRGKVDGEEHQIVNSGSFNLVIKHESALSIAANRFHNSTGADITLAADQAADLVYDATTARWRVFKRN